MLGQVRGSADRHPAGSSQGRRRACHGHGARPPVLCAGHRLKLRKHDEIRFHGGVEWGMVGGSRARAVADGAMGTRFVSRRARRAVTVTALGGALCLLATACSGGDSEAADDEPRAETEDEATTTTLDPEEAARQEVITAREAADEAQIEALGPPTPNPDLPALAETHTGLMLERISETAAGLKRNGYAERSPENSQRSLEVESVRFDTVDGTEVAFLEVCRVGDSERIVVASGEVLTEGLWTFHTTEAMEKVDGVWKLAERRPDSAEEGVTGCAAD